MLNIDYPQKGNIVIPICEPCIDSLSLSIEESKVKVLDHRINSETITYYVDIDEYDDEVKKPKPYIYEKDGIRIRFTKVMRMQHDGTQLSMLNITLSSKLLHERYFQGFKNYNIHLAYEFLMSMKIVSFSIQDFLNAHVSDIDICYNFYTKPNLFLGLVSYYEKILKKGTSRYFTPHKKITRDGDILNLGLSFNDRQKSSPARPYVKFYYKKIELEGKSSDFYEKFLKPHNPIIENLFRLEYTIKNYKHKERLLKKKYLISSFRSLNDLLSIPVTQLKKIALSFQFDYFDKKEDDTSYLRELKDISPTHLLICDLMAQLITRGVSETEIYRVINSFDRKQKSRTKTLIKKLLDHVKNSSQSLTNQIKNNTDLDTLVKSLQF